MIVTKNLIVLLEKLSKVSTENTQKIVDFLLAEYPAVEEMKQKRCGDHSKTGMIQIRVKPLEKETDLKDILSAIEKILRGSGKKMGITGVEENKSSVHSGKYSSISFDYAGDKYDIVIAKGANGGETFEKELLLKLDNQVKGIDNNEEAVAALDALHEVDSDINPGSINNITPRSGSTKRSMDMSPAEMGKIIADIIIETKHGDKYVSVKNSSGKTLAQFGVSKFINDDFSVNTKSEEWKKWFVPFGLDPSKITEGLLVAKNGGEVDFDETETVSKKIKKTDAVFKILALMWGSDYIYLREKGKKFLCMKIDDDCVENKLLKNLKVTKISYPCSLRKQINVYLESDNIDYKIEFRNPRGKGDIKPTQIQLSITKTKLDF